ncbi:MAG TPA: recombinase family protein, partial [Tepidisphaeraceae bacterium]|nr:recombinase family protein [Tepidisphaeraceae bacterium]
MRQPIALPTLTALLLGRGSAPYSAFSSVVGAFVMACVFLVAGAATGAPTGSAVNPSSSVTVGSARAIGAGAAAATAQQPSPTRPPIAIKLPGGRRRRGAIYARYSSRFQHSIDDQVQTCRAWAAANDVDVPDELVFTDARTSGKKNRR